MKIPFTSIKEKVRLNQKQYLKATKRVLNSGRFILGPEVKSFERDFAKYLKVKYALGVANGFEALKISLMALGIKIGDEVITTPVSALATALAINSVGAKPVFVDVNTQGLIDISLIEEKINEKTKAILPVHLYGQACDLDKLLNLCKKYNLYLVEDAAQAAGTTFRGKLLGTFGSVGCFSFYPTKNLGALGDGGAIVTNSESLYNLIAALRNYGLDELQAAYLKVNLKVLDKNNRKRKYIAKRYIKNLTKFDQIKIVTDDLINSNFHIFALRSQKRDSLKKFLQVKGIETLIHYPKIIPDHPIFNEKNDTFKKSGQFVSEVLSLPCHILLIKREIDYICFMVKQFYEKH